jgi:WD40 repeat protein/class 3 adenylate cyclase
MIRSIEGHIQDGAIPSGTVTFLFTDIEGSTKLLEKLQKQYAALLEEQRDLLRAAFARWNGYEIDTQGDAFFAAFPRALDAVSCVVEMQRELAAHDWPQGVLLRVRMGLHTGEPVVARTGYVGMDVHRAARLASAGYGGQVLVSQATRELIYQDLPSETRLRDLGEYKLKDIRFPQRIYQLDIDGLEDEFPELKTLSAAETPPTPGEAPYQGLRFFDEKEAGWFYGRQKVTARLVEAVMALQALPPASGGLRFLAVIGASGSGKSSVVRAGLVPSLKQAQPGGWQVHVITPSAHPLESLAVSLTKTSESVSATTTLIDDLRRDTRSLHLYIQKMWPAFEPRLLLVIDQFEELFTQCREEAERQAFIGNLLNAIGTDGHPATVVITLRADFYDRLAQYAELREAVSADQVYIGAMSSDELSQAIEEPARRGGWELTPGLVELMLHDTGAGDNRQPEPGALPLLSHALLETWNRRRGNLMNLKAYTESGGVRGAIAHTAERVYQFELNTEQQGIARGIFLRLTELGEGTQDTRRRISIHELLPPGPATDSEQVQAVLLKLADARLITTGEGTVEVSHEALIREWPVLRDWLAADREGLRLHRHLTEAAQEWEQQERDAGALYRGARLAQALEWALNNPRQLNAQEQAFLNASKEDSEREAAEREAQRQRELKAALELAETQSRAAKQLRRRAIFLTGAFVLAIALAGLAIFFGNQANQNATEAQAANRIATSRDLAGASLINLDIDPERSILLALQAALKADTFQAQDALHRAVQTSRLLKRASAPLGECHCLIAYSPDGARLATESRDAQGQLTTQIRDATTLEVLFTKPGVWADDRWLDAGYLPIATPGADRASTILTVWDATGQKVITTVTLPIYFDENAPFIDISPDQTKVAAVSSRDLSNLAIFDMATGQMLPHLGKPGYGYNGMLRFSPDSRSLLTIGALTNDKQEATLWEVATGGVLLNVPVQGQPKLIDFSPDGKQFAIDELQFVRIVDIGSGQDVVKLSGHTSLVENGLQFNGDGTRIVTVAGDGTSRIWDAATGQSLLTVFGNDALIRTAALSPDGARLATLSATGVQTWAIAPTDTREWLAVPAVLECDCMVAYSPDGLGLAIFGGDNTVKVLDSSSGQTRLTLPDPGNQGRGLAFSPDGKRLATAGADNLAHVWDLVTGKELMALAGHTAPVDRVIYSPDGSRLATIDRSGEARLWDATSGQTLFSMQAFDGNTIQEGNDVGIAFTRDGSRLATAGGASIKIWDTHTGQATLTLPPVEGLLAYAVTFSPDGKHLAVGFRVGSANVWDAATGQKLFDLSGHTGSVRHIEYSPDGTRIATASADGTARLWDAATGVEQFALTGQTGQVTGLAFSPDGARLATGSRDGTVRVYALRLEDLIKIAQSRVTRALTLEECQKYLHMQACPATP